MKKSISIEDARQRLARVAEQNGERQFAREVLAGCWDHRNDLQAVLNGGALRGEVIGESK